MSDNPHEYADKAEMLLLMAGEPSTPSDKIAAAQAWAILGLVRLQAPRRPPLTGNGIVPDGVRALMPTYYPAEIISVFQQAELDQPGWWEGGRKIQGIKAIRTATNLGLKEAKDIVEAVDRRFW